MGRVGVLEWLKGGAGAVLVVVWFALLAGVFMGGISYRKECLEPDGHISKEWDFTWFAPIPYLFRPSEGGCIVHTGTRVALNEVGIATFKRTTPDLVARKFEDETPNREAGYLGRLKVVLTDFVNSARGSKGFEDAFRITSRAERRIGALDPPPRLSDLHNRLLAALQSANEHGREAQAALRAGERARFNSAIRKLGVDNRQMMRLLRQVNREIAAL